MIAVVCQSCRKRLNAPDAAGGRVVKCPVCGGAMSVPGQTAAVRYVVAEQAGNPFDFGGPCPVVESVLHSVTGEPVRERAVSWRGLWIAIGGGVLALIALVSVIVVVLKNKEASDRKEDVDQAKTEITMTKIDALTNICDQFFTRFERFPDTIDELMMPIQDPITGSGTMPYVKSELALQDLWGNRLKYDPSGKKFNGGKRPDIWTEHDGKVLHNGGR